MNRTSGDVVQLFAHGTPNALQAVGTGVRQVTKEMVTLPTSHSVVMTMYSQHLAAQGCSNRTITERNCSVGHMSRFLGKDPREATMTDITAWLGRPNLCRNSRSTYWGHIASFYRWATATGQVQINPMLGVPRPHASKGLPRPLPPVVVDAALLRARGRTRTYLLLALYAGLRAHEIAKIRGEHISQTDLFVHGKGDRDDTIPTHAILWDEAERYTRQGYWFPTGSAYQHVRGTSVTIAVRRLLVSVGYDGHLHQARHSFGTNVLRAAGGNVRVAQELLRHQNLQTTALYTQVDDHERRAALNGLGA